MCLPLSAITDTAAPLNWSSAAFLYEEPVNNERCCLHWLWSISQYGLSTMSACYCPCRQWGSVIMSGGHTQGVQGDVDGPPIDLTDECKWAPVSFTLRGWLQNQIVRLHWDQQRSTGDSLYGQRHTAHIDLSSNLFDAGGVSKTHLFWKPWKFQPGNPPSGPATQYLTAPAPGSGCMRFRCCNRNPRLSHRDVLRLNQSG